MFRIDCEMDGVELRKVAACLGAMADVLAGSTALDIKKDDVAFHVSQPVETPSVVFQAPAVDSGAHSYTEAAAPPPPPVETPAQLLAQDTAALAPDRDSAGMPWDARIHASSRALVADGTWRMKRGVDPALVAQVTAQIRGALAAPAPAPSPAVPPPPPPAGAPAPATLPDIPGLLRRCTAAQIPPATVADAAQSVGLEGIGLLSLRPELFPAVEAYLFGGAQ